MATKRTKGKKAAQSGLFGADLSPWRSERRNISLARQMEMIARIHSPAVAQLQVDSRLQAPGASDGGDILLNPKLLPIPVGRDAIATWIGVTMHEVGHCQWSPVKIPHADQEIYNLVEDARQEALLIQKLPGTVAPLTRAVADLIVDANPGIVAIGNTPPSPAQIWPLVAGRLYLPDKLRRTVYDGAVAQMGRAWADEVRQVVLDYCKLMDPGFSDVLPAQRLIARMKELVGELPQPVVVACYSHGTDDPDVTAPMMPVDSIPSGGDDDDEDSEADGDADESGEGGADGDADDGESDGKGTSKSQSQSKPGGGGAGSGGAGSGDAKKDAATKKAARDVQQAAKDAAKDAADDMAKIIDTVMDRSMIDEFAATNLDTKPHLSTQKVSREARMVVARLMSALKPLTDQAEAGLDKMTPAGRLRPDRIDRGYRPDHVFDKWQLDLNDTVSAEIVVAVDVSGSMSTYQSQLTEAVWVMRQVAARTAAKLTVLAWDNRVEVVTSPLRNDVAWSPYRGGGTNGAPMLRIAIDILAQSKEARKWLLIMTDGDVSDATETAGQVRRLRSYPDIAVTPIGFGFRSKPEVFGANAQQIGDLMDIPKVIGAMLYDLYRKNIVR